MQAHSQTALELLQIIAVSKETRLILYKHILEVTGHFVNNFFICILQRKTLSSVFSDVVGFLGLLLSFLAWPVCCKGVLLCMRNGILFLFREVHSEQVPYSVHVHVYPVLI